MIGEDIQRKKKKRKKRQETRKENDNKKGKIVVAQEGKEKKVTHRQFSELELEEEEEVRLFRPTHAHPDAAVTINLNQLRPFTVLLEVLSNVLKDCTFKIVCEGNNSSNKEKPDLVKNTREVYCPKGDVERNRGGEKGARGSASFTGLYGSCIDESQTCIVLFKFYGEVLVSENEQAKDPKNFEFTLNLNTLYNLVRSYDNDFCLQLYRKIGEPGIFLKAFPKVAAATTKARQYRHSRVEQITGGGEETFDISSITYEYKVMMQLQEIRKIVRLAKNLGSEFIRIRIIEPKKNKNLISEAGKEENCCSYRRFFFIVQTYGQGSSDERIFCSFTKERKTATKKNDEKKKKGDGGGDGTLRDFVILNGSGNSINNNGSSSSNTKSSINNIGNTEEKREDPDDPKQYRRSEVEEKYNEVFRVENLGRFLKALDGNRIYFQFEAEKPMLVSSPLGDETSYIVFVLSARTNDDGIPNELEAFSSG